MPSFIPSGPVLPGSVDSNSRGSSAAVLEFMCLFTHDLRRKQKRWQDGRLKYHTFNKRVMVYDDRGNFVGDMHWQREWEFDEGEEVQLERGGVIVQVAECVGQENQDLSELLDKRAKEKEQRQSRVVMRPSVSVASPQTPAPGLGDHFQTRHRPLHQLIGTPTGHHGRAVVPTESPFELRQRANETPETRTDSRPAAKRRKYDDTQSSKMGYAQSLFGAPLTLSAVPTSSAPVPRPTSQAYRAQPEPSSPTEEVIPEIEPPRERRTLGFPRANPMPSLLQTVTRPDVGTSLANQDVPKSASAFDRSRLISGPQMATSTSASIADRRLDCLMDEQAPTNGAKRKTASKRAERKSAVQKPQPANETGDVEVGSGSGLNSRPKSGSSRSKAIVLDDNLADRLDKVDQGHKPSRRANKTVVPKPLALNVGRQNGARLDSLLQSPAEESKSADPPPDEERTELRLKPRQKRGLLLVSEKKSRAKRPKKQTVLTKALTPTPEFSEPPTKAATPEPSLRIDDEALDIWSTPRHDDPFQLSPMAPECPLPELGLPSPQPLGNQTSQPPEPAGRFRHKECSPPPGVVEDEHGTSTVDPPSPPAPSPDASNKTRNEMKDLSSSPPPKRRRTSRRVMSVQPQKESSGMTSPSLEDTSPDPAPETRRSKPPKQTLRVDNSDDETPSRPKKKVQRAEKEDGDNEEPTRVPVRPHLTKLSRKSVRSREIIGFVMSSPPVLSAAIPEQPPSEPSHNTGRLPAMSDIGIAFPDSGNPPASALPVSDGTGRLAEKAQAPLLPTALMDDPPIIQRKTSLTDGGMNKRATSEARKEKGSSTTQQLDDPPSRLGLAGKAQTSLFSTTLVDNPPALQRSTSLAGGRMSEMATHEARKETGGSSTTQRLGDPPSRSGLARHRSAVFAPTNGIDDSVWSTVPGPQNITASERNTASTTVRPGSADRMKPSTTETPFLPPQLHKSRSLILPEHPQHPIIDTPDIATASRVTEGLSNPLPDFPLAGPSRPRLTNPASRGRKAALKSDAAGQVPKSILPPAEPVPVRVGMRPPAAGQRDPAIVVNERPRRGMRFPGFVSANGGGGPWSREAHDLLESARPC